MVVSHHIAMLTSTKQMDGSQQLGSWTMHDLYELYRYTQRYA